MIQGNAQQRKAIPIATGCLDYFPLALAAIAELSVIGNNQHNPGQPLHWDRSKSTDEADALIRHFMDRGTVDTDGVRHSCKLAWRALALLQKEIEASQARPMATTSLTPVNVLRQPDDFADSTVEDRRTGPKNRRKVPSNVGFTVGASRRRPYGIGRAVTRFPGGVRREGRRSADPIWPAQTADF